MLGERASPKQLAELRAEFGLDRPILEQYLRYITRIARLDFGTSIKTGRSVLDEVGELLPATFELSIASILFATLGGIFIGVITAVHRNSLIDYGITVGSLVGVSMPVFWLGLVAIMIFSVRLDLFPTGGRIDLRYFFESITNFYVIDSIILWFQESDPSYLVSTIHHLILPTIVLGTIPLAIIARTTRTSMLEVLSQDYIRTARAAGIREHKIIFIYALRNAFLPILTVIGVQFGVLLSSAILTETVFSWPGIGKWLYKAIEARDFPAVQGGVVLVVLFFMIINLAVDLLYSVINPRIRLGG